MDAAQVIQLFACCSDDCPPCPETVWQPGPGRAASSGRDAITATMASRGRAPPRCGLELGRWVTPFRRRNPLGWITDASTLLPALLPRAGSGHAKHGQQCTFTLQTAPWASGWRASLDLRFQVAQKSQDRDADGSSGGERSSRRLHASRAVRGTLSGTLSAGPSKHALRLMQQPTWPAPAGRQTQEATHGSPLQLLAPGWRPVAFITLFSGGVFNGSYNLRDPITFVSPVPAAQEGGGAPSPMRGVLSALISGHGEDGADACAEFCPTRCGAVQ